MMDAARRKLFEATTAVECAEQDVARNELQASLAALAAQVQVAEDTVVTLAGHLDHDPPPQPPIDSAADEAETAAAAAEATAVFSPAYLGEVLDQQGILGEPTNIGLSEVLNCVMLR